MVEDGDPEADSGVPIQSGGAGGAGGGSRAFLDSSGVGA